jgi:hypothetical protein
MNSSEIETLDQQRFYIPKEMKTLCQPDAGISAGIDQFENVLAPGELSF